MDRFLEEAVAAARSRTSWNERLSHWERPASDSEELRIQRAAGQVRSALLSSQWLVEQGIEVRPQGSYRNNTNVRLQADMDVHVWNAATRLSYEAGVDAQAAFGALQYSYRSETFSGLAARMRAEIALSLETASGAPVTKPGTKAYTVAAIPNARSPADITPVFRFCHIVRAGLFGFQQREFGFSAQMGESESTSQSNTVKMVWKSGIGQRTDTSE